VKSRIVGDVREPEKKPFPKLMISNNHDGLPGMVALFQEKNVGAVIFLPGNFDKEWTLGEIYYSFDDDCFEDFTGTIELSND